LLLGFRLQSHTVEGSSHKNLGDALESQKGVLVPFDSGEIEFIVLDTAAAARHTPHHIADPALGNMQRPPLPLIAGILLVSIGIKLLLIPAYRSTDFEVHRNWLAMTCTLPLREWYFDSTSEWTLDYPPFFAYFEWLMCQVAKLVDSDMVRISTKGYASESTVLFQRGSVIFTDLVLFLSTWYYIFATVRSPPHTQTHTHTPRVSYQIFALVIFNGGLLIVDHIHFQYNGMLLGMLVLCLALAKDDRPIALAAVFSVLVLLKHLFLTLAPVFALYLLLVYCRISTESWITVTFRMSQLAGIAFAALAAAFAPFCVFSNGCHEQLAQIVSRLFPFGRGLVHAYWAPNVWALYYAIDSILAGLGRRWGFFAPYQVAATRGLVGDYPPSLLWAISPASTMCLVILSLIPAVYALFLRPHPSTLTRCVVYASLSAFMLGYHVHEKAILVPLVVQTLVLADDYDDDDGGANRPPTRVHQRHKAAAASDNITPYHHPTKTPLFLLLAGAGTISLFPLLMNLPEFLPKAALGLCYLASVWSFCSTTKHTSPTQTTHRSRPSPPLPHSTAISVVYKGLIPLLFAATEIAHPLLWGQSKMPFLPLMTTSTVCALILIYAWWLSFWQMLCGETATPSLRATLPGPVFHTPTPSPPPPTPTPTPASNRLRSRLKAPTAIALLFLFQLPHHVDSSPPRRPPAATTSPPLKQTIINPLYRQGLTDTLLLEFSRRGHCKIQGLIAQKHVEKMHCAMKLEYSQRKQEAENHFASVVGSGNGPAGQPVGAPPFFQLFNTWRTTTNTPVREFILDAGLGEIAAAVLDVPAVRLFQDSTFIKAQGCSPTSWHSDLRMTPLNTNEFVTFWIPLCPVPDQESGGTGLSYASKSHTDFAAAFWYEIDMVDLSERYEVEDHGDYSLGDVSIHHGWCLHSSPSNEQEETRYALSLSYCADGAPLLPRDDRGEFSIDSCGLARIPDCEDKPSWSEWLTEAGDFLETDQCPIVYKSD